MATPPKAFRFPSATASAYVIAITLLALLVLDTAQLSRVAQASSGWQLQELWHTAVEPPSLPFGTCGIGGNGLSDLTYYSGTIYGTFLYQSICAAPLKRLTNGFDAATGASKWRQIAGSYWQAPLVSNGIIVIPDYYQWVFSTSLQAYDVINEQTTWLWYAVGTDAVIDNGVVYVQLGSGIGSGPLGSIYSFDLQSGQTRWSNTDYVCGGDPKIELSNGIVYYIGCTNFDGTYSVQARNTTDGSLIWSKNINAPSTYGNNVPGLRASKSANFP